MGRRGVTVKFYFAGILLLGGALLSACGSSDHPTSGAAAGDGGVVVESIVTDSAAVQAASPPTTGIADQAAVTGLLAYVAGTQPTRLVVFCHGLGHDIEIGWAEHIRRTVRPDTAVVATNYRDNDKLPILRGAQDTIAATLYAKQRFPSVETVYLLGISLGGAVSGTAITESVHVTPDGRGLYDYWVDVEGLSNLIEAWTEAAGAAPEFAGFMEEETGGTPLTQPEAYMRRSTALRTQEMAAAGLRAVAVVHDVNDGLVVTNQGRETATAFVAVGIPVQLITVLRHAEGQDPGTTGTGVLGGVLGLEDPNQLVHLAGHGDESDYDHPVIRTGFEQLELMLDGTYDETTPYNEQIVDDSL
jgi:hypothetical protein